MAVGFPNFFVPYTTIIKIDTKFYDSRHTSKAARGREFEHRHESDEVYRLAQGIIETYFGIDDEADTAPSPPSIISTTRQCLTQTDSTTSARSNIPSPIKLQVPGDRTVINFFRADEFVKVWTEQLLDHRAKVQAAMENNGEEIPNTILCDRISLSGESYTPDAAEVIASFLSEPFQDGLPIAFGIVEVDLSDMIASQLTDSGLKVLRTICDAFADSELVEVNLSENAIGEQGAESCMTVLNKPSLRRLSLCNNGLAAETMADIADMLTNDEYGYGCIAEKLTKIHFFNNMSGPIGCREFARILEKSKELMDVRFSSTRARQEGTNILARALKTCLTGGRNPSLQKLDLCDNHFDSCESQIDLCEALAATKHLTYLDLSDCELGDDGVQEVCCSLSKSDAQLEHLDLGSNELTGQGAEHVANYIRDCAALRVLRMKDNDITSDGVVLIAAAFRVSEARGTVEELLLDSNNIGTKGARALIDVYGPDGKGMPNLKSISLNRNSFTEHVVAELGAAFQDKLLEIDENDLEGKADE
jgi:Ran GTPase-activating protein 1